MLKTRSIVFINALLTISLLLIAFGCSTEKTNPNFVNPIAHPELVDQSWLTGKPCTLPCWQGLEPGKTTREDILKTLPKLTFLDAQKGITDFAGQEFVKCKQPFEKDCLFFILKNERLESLGFLPNYSLTLNEVIAQLGEPDFYTIFHADERRDCLFRVFWLHQRLELRNRYIGKGYLPFQHDLCDQIQESGGKVPKNVEIQMVSIYSPEELNNLIKILSEGTRTELWKGFSE
jgi:hypothetical protein